MPTPIECAKSWPTYLTYCILLADRIGADPNQIVLDKLALTRAKYPADKARGRSAKYDAL
jgi:hypothetical protein